MYATWHSPSGKVYRQVAVMGRVEPGQEVEFVPGLEESTPPVVRARSGKRYVGRNPWPFGFNNAEMMWLPW